MLEWLSGLTGRANVVCNDREEGAEIGVYRMQRKHLISRGEGEIGRRYERYKGACMHACGRECGWIQAPVKKMRLWSECLSPRHFPPFLCVIILFIIILRTFADTPFQMAGPGLKSSLSTSLSSPERRGVSSLKCRICSGLWCIRVRGSTLLSQGGGRVSSCILSFGFIVFSPILVSLDNVDRRCTTKYIGVTVEQRELTIPPSTYAGPPQVSTHRLTAYSSPLHSLCPSVTLFQQPQYSRGIVPLYRACHLGSMMR